MSLPYVLVVESYPSLQKLYAYLLRRAGYRVIVVADIHLALGQIRALRPQAVIVDLSLLRRSGLLVARILRRRLGPVGVPLLLVTDQKDRWSRSDALAAGADELLCVPEGLDALAQTMTHLLLRADRNQQSQPKDP